MMVPDFTLIAEIMMFSEGFSSAKVGGCLVTTTAQLPVPHVPRSHACFTADTGSIGLHCQSTVLMIMYPPHTPSQVLAKKMIAIMELSQQQLSKQDHYDYGLRSFVIPIARAAGSLKRVDPDASEEVIL